MHRKKAVRISAAPTYPARSRASTASQAVRYAGADCDTADADIVKMDQPGFLMRLRAEATVQSGHAP
jgi:hypothetical protein